MDYILRHQAHLKPKRPVLRTVAQPAGKPQHLNRELTHVVDQIQAAAQLAELEKTPA